MGKESQDFFFLGEVDWCERRLLALNLAKNLGGDGRVEVDGVVPQALRGLVAFATATLEGFPHTNLCAVAVLGVVFDTIHILVSLLTPRDGAGERLFIGPVHGHGAEDGLRADGAFCGPRLIAIRLLVVYLLLIILAACRCAAAE